MARTACALAVGLAVLTVVSGCAPARAEGDVHYRPPVDAPVSDHYRPPPERWDAGNRGITYDTEPGAPVHAAADGDVVFAGDVAGSLHVTLRHADGLRTTYSFLQTIAVHEGDHVRQGDVVGTAGDSFHFSARRPDDSYVDPESLFDGDAAHLVPEHERHADNEAPGGERAAIVRLLQAIGSAPVRAGSEGVAWARRTAAPAVVAAGGDVTGAVARAVTARAIAVGRVARGVLELQPCFQVLAVASGVAAWDAQRHRCTPASVVPPALASRHRLVLVGGLGSSSHQAAVDDVPAARMGYAPGDVTRFSYTGGTVGEHAYAPADTEADLRRSGERLRALLTDLARREPGVPVDVIAHSQGGVVTRVALGDEVDHADPALPPLGTVVTLGSPHDGANLATALALLRHAPAGRAALGGARRLSGTPLDPGSRAIRQLAETSSFMRRLASRPVPPRIRFTSIGARGDLVVPAPHTHLPGANNVVVPVAGVLHDHDRLPSSPAAQREMALAVDGMPPTCQGLGDAVGDAVVGRGIAAGEDLAGGALFGAAEAAVPGWVP